MTSPISHFISQPRTSSQPEFCKADETEMRAASRSVGRSVAVVGTTGREQRLLSERRLSEATVVVEERMAKVKPASGVQRPQKGTLYASTGRFAR